MEISLCKSNFKEEIEKNKNKILVLDFYADWCNPCKMLAPILSEISKENNNVIIGKVNVDEEIDLAKKYEILSIPTLIFIKGGVVVNKSVGYIDKNSILNYIKNM